MLGKIESVEEVVVRHSEFGDMIGYIVRTDEHTYYVLIDNDARCCESWGYFASEDDPGYFTGAELFEVRLTDKALNTIMVEKSGRYGRDGGGVQFVDFITDRGVLQLAVYNDHNGYYGHRIVVLVDDDVAFRDYL